MCGSDEDKEIKIEFFQSEKNGKHKNIGQSLFTINTLKGKTEYELSLNKASKGKFTFRNIRFTNRNSFLEYIFGGCELNLAIGIDFTLSNGKPNCGNSLHDLNLNKNEYYKAL